MMAPLAPPLDQPVWYEPLRAPSWLVPRVRDGATEILFCAETWDETGVDAAGTDLRLGLPLFLAEATRFSTNARPAALREAVEPTDLLPEAPLTVRCAVAPEAGPAIRVRVLDPLGTIVAEIAREAHDEATLGAALESLPHAVVEVVASNGVRPIWNSLYGFPAGGGLVSYVRGQRASVRLGEGVLPDSADADATTERRASVKAVLEALGSLATSTSEPFPALLFFGALLAAHDAGSPVVGELRLLTNARCTAATDPLDPVFAMTALVARVFGDLQLSERRMSVLRSGDDASVKRWLSRVQAVT